MKELLIQRPSQVISNTIQGTEYNSYLHGDIVSSGLCKAAVKAKEKEKFH